MMNTHADSVPRACCLLRSGRRLEVSLLDISAGGCLIECRGWAAKPGDGLSIKLPGLTFQPASVVWTEDCRAGIAFEHQLYEPTLEHLRRSFDSASSS